MKPSLGTLCYLAAAVVIAVAGILGRIDQTTMIVMVVVLTCCIPDRQGRCLRRACA